MDELRHLRGGETSYPATLDPGLLDTFPNPRPGRAYTVEFESHEVTSLCPVTGQPDFYRVRIAYAPAARCVESKSLKLYLFSYRGTGLFAEDMANRMLDDLVRACAPAWMRVDCRMNARGGIGLRVCAEHGAAPALPRDAGCAGPESGHTSP
jgi:7-cyano-7-deazaguanine reductase